MATDIKVDMNRYNGTDYDTLLPRTSIEQVDDLQTTLNSKQATVTGAATTITSSNLTVNCALVSNSSGKVAVSAVTSTELGYLDGVTSNVQTQLNAKQASISGGASTITSSNLTTNRALVSNASGKVAVSAVTSTELGYLDGVTSNVQTQLNAKQSLVKKATITLSTSWTGSASPYTQTVTVSGGTADTQVDLQADATVIQQMLDDGTTALFIANNSGTFTAYAVGKKPTAALSIQATLTTVSS